MKRFLAVLVLVVLSGCANVPYPLRPCLPGQGPPSERAGSNCNWFGPTYEGYMRYYVDPWLYKHLEPTFDALRPEPGKRPERSTSEATRALTT